MAWVAAIVAGGAEAIKAHKAQGAKEDEAKAYRDAGVRNMAAGTRDVQEAERQKAFMDSRAVAVGAASGSGMDSPGMVKVLSDLAAEGEYRVLATLWSAQDDYQGKLFRADAALREAKSIKSMTAINMVTSAISAYYGAGGRGTSTSLGGSGVASAGYKSTIKATGGMEIPGYGVYQGSMNA